MPDVATRIRWVRWSLVTELLFMAIVYELGVTLTVAGVFPNVPASGFCLGAFASYVGAGGGALLLHAILGLIILANATFALVLALGLRVRWLRITSIVAFIFVLSAGAGGFLFVLSGFADDGYSYQMSTGFLIAFVFTFLSLYVLRSPEPAAASAEPS